MWSCNLPTMHVLIIVTLANGDDWALKNWCFWTVVLEKILESSLDFKEIKVVNPKDNQTLSIHWKDCCWSSNNTLATWCKEPTHWERPWCWEKLRAGGEGDDRRWDGWMASQTHQTWVWTNSRRWWRTGNPGVLESMGLQRATNNNQQPLFICSYLCLLLHLF